MNEENIENKTVVEQDEQSVSVGKFFRDLKKHRRLYYIVMPVTIVVVTFMLLNIPDYYRCEVVLAPEVSRSGSSNSLASLANSLGVKFGSGSTGEALFPTLYPSLMDNVDFKVSLFNVPVTIEGNAEKGVPDRTMTYYDYLRTEQRRPWWKTAIGGTIGFVKSLFKEAKPRDTIVNPFRLNKEQAAIVEKMEKNIDCDVNARSLVITITVTDQEPLICAVIADTVKNRLQAFITDYRTSKARVDLEYSRALYHETKVRYEKARQKYAEFMDANQDIILQTVRQRQTDLENELQLQYNAYTQVAAQLLAAEAKVQEETPAFTTLQSATVPVEKAGPVRKRWFLFWVFMAFFGTTAYILHKEGDLKQIFGGFSK